MKQSLIGTSILLISGLVAGCSTEPSATGRVNFQLATLGTGASTSAVPFGSTTITVGTDVLEITSVQLVAREGDHATLRLRSGEMRKVLADCMATIGEVGNIEHNLRTLGKAGAKRWRGIRPTVRGVAMNPVDHPHGGGEGRTSGGRHPVSPWGTPTKGYRTRRNKRTSGMIIRRRHSK